MKSRKLNSPKKRRATEFFRKKNQSAKQKNFRDFPESESAHHKHLQIAKCYVRNSTTNSNTETRFYLLKKEKRNPTRFNHQNPLISELRQRESRGCCCDSQANCCCDSQSDNSARCCSSSRRDSHGSSRLESNPKNNFRRKRYVFARRTNANNGNAEAESSFLFAIQILRIKRVFAFRERKIPCEQTR